MRAAVNVSGTCQGHTQGHAPPRLHPGHVSLKEPLFPGDYKVGWYMQAENLAHSLLASRPAAHTLSGKWLCLCKYQFPPLQNGENNAFPTHLQGL